VKTKYGWSRRPIAGSKSSTAPLERDPAQPCRTRVTQPEESIDSPGVGQPATRNLRQLLGQQIGGYDEAFAVVPASCSMIESPSGRVVPAAGVDQSMNAMSSPTTPKPRHRRLQFSLRTLLVLVLFSYRRGVEASPRTDGTSRTGARQHAGDGRGARQFSGTHPPAPCRWIQDLATRRRPFPSAAGSWWGKRVVHKPDSSRHGEPAEKVVG
jgi:hypothetical protein